MSHKDNLINLAVAVIEPAYWYTSLALTILGLGIRRPRPPDSRDSGNKDAPLDFDDFGEKTCMPGVLCATCRAMFRRSKIVNGSKALFVRQTEKPSCHHTVRDLQTSVESQCHVCTIVWLEISEQCSRSRNHVRPDWEVVTRITLGLEVFSSTSCCGSLSVEVKPPPEGMPVLPIGIASRYDSTPPTISLDIRQSFNSMSVSSFAGSSATSDGLPVLKLRRGPKICTSCSFLHGNVFYCSYASRKILVAAMSREASLLFREQDDDLTVSVDLYR